MEDPDTTWALALVVERFRWRLTETEISPFFRELQFRPMVLVRIKQIQMTEMVEVGPEVLFALPGITLSIMVLFQPRVQLVQSWLVEVAGGLPSIFVPG